MSPLVSIIMPSFNCSRFITATIASVLSQSYSNWELILIDDASTDDSVEVIKTFMAKDQRIRLLTLDRNSGPAVARNKGIKEAQGRYIAFLDSDDIWHRDKLEKQLAFMQAKDIAFSFTAYNMMDEKNKRRIAVHNVPENIDYKTLLKTNVIGCSTVIYDTAKIGKIDFPLIQKRQDFALWLKILHTHGTGYGLQEALVDYTLRTDSVSSNRLSAVRYTWRVYREIEKLSFFKALYYFAHYVLRALNKYWL